MLVLIAVHMSYTDRRDVPSADIRPVCESMAIDRHSNASEHLVHIPDSGVCQAFGCMNILLVVLLSLTSLPAIAGDACDAQLPRALKALVAKAIPAFRTPAVTDNQSEDVQWDIKQKRNGCLKVAKADFDGDGTQDYLLGLTAKQGDGAIVLVALTRNGKWQFHQLDKLREGRTRLYVSARLVLRLMRPSHFA